MIKCHKCGLIIPEHKTKNLKPCVCLDYREIFARNKQVMHPKTKEVFIIKRKNLLRSRKRLLQSNRNRLMETKNGRRQKSTTKKV